MGIPIIGDIIGAVKDLVSEVVVDKDRRNELNVRLQELADKADSRLHDELMGQIEINKVEAAHPSIFVAGWRPFIGWVSGAALTWTFIVSPIFEWASRLFGWTGPMPELDTGQLIALVMAMLGVGAQRTVEKVRGVDTRRIQPKQN